MINIINSKLDKEALDNCGAGVRMKLIIPPELCKSATTLVHDRVKEFADANKDVFTEFEAIERYAAQVIYDNNLKSNEWILSTPENIYYASL